MNWFRDLFSSKPKLLSEMEFTNAFLVRAHEVAPQLVFKILNPLALERSMPDGTTSLTGLQNAYDYYRQGELLGPVIERYLAAAIEMTPGAEPNSEFLVPLMKPRDYVESMKRGLAAQTGQAIDTIDVSLATLEYPPDLLVVFAFDSPSSMRMATLEEVESLGTPEALLEQAVQNLGRLLPNAATTSFQNIWRVQLDGTYDASLMLGHRFWDAIETQLGGPVAVAVPSRDVLLYGSADDPSHLSTLRTFAGKFYEFNYPVSPSVYARRNRVWTFQV